MDRPSADLNFSRDPPRDEMPDSVWHWPLSPQAKGLVLARTHGINRYIFVQFARN